MQEKQRNILRVAAVIDAVVAIALLGAIFVIGSNLPIVIPLLLLVTAAGLFIVTIPRG